MGPTPDGSDDPRPHEAETFGLLDAINTNGVQTTADVADWLGLDASEVVRQLRDAERAGLVVETEDVSLNVSEDFDHQFWRLTDKGHAQRDRLEDEWG
jgi:DNA-binding MarR family transcriptional regulator